MRFMKLMVDQRNSELLLVRVALFVSRDNPCRVVLFLHSNISFGFLVKKNKDEIY